MPQILLQDSESKGIQCVLIKDKSYKPLKNIKIGKNSLFPIIQLKYFLQYFTTQNL